MTPNQSADIRAAAERLRRAATGEPLTDIYNTDREDADHCWDADANVIVHQWLADHPADDDQAARLRCIFCDFTGDTLQSLREHSAECGNHPGNIIARAFYTRIRLAAGMLIEEIGASGPENIDVTARRAVNKLREQSARVATLTAENARITELADALWKAAKEAGCEITIYPRHDDCRADAKRLYVTNALAAELAERTRELDTFRAAINSDAADTDAARQLASSVLPAAHSVGDSHCVPPIVDVVAALLRLLKDTDHAD